ncbi:MAG: esterase-like activity of phytase family protein [Planctomycetes bacterium]|nr:esterase-like activity of phytase family protein [Planctomycetota bacterium]
MRPLILLACLGIGANAAASDAYFFDVPLLPATSYLSHQLTVGIGSGAFHRPGDPSPLVWTCTDRGPNADFKNGKQYPLPEFAPSIYALWAHRNGARVIAHIPLSDRAGLPLSGLSNPLSAPALSEAAYGPTGALLAPDPAGIDIEALVKLGDGSFWLADENAPSLLHVDANGRVLRRLVPDGVAASLAGAQSRYDIAGTLPRILRLRRVNRGFEAIAVAPGDAVLYTALQSPLDHPANSAKPTPSPRLSRTVRLLRVDSASGAATAEWAYDCERFTDFHDPVALNPNPKQGDVKISELVAVDADRLIVLERTDFKAKLFLVDLRVPATDLLGSRWDDEATRPTLEQIDLAHPGVGDPILPLSKTLIFDQDVDCPEIPGKIEGVALINPSTIMLINDNDFAIGGERTVITFVVLPPRARH